MMLMTAVRRDGAFDGVGQSDQAGALPVGQLPLRADWLLPRPRLVPPAVDCPATTCRRPRRQRLRLVLLALRPFLPPAPRPQGRRSLHPDSVTRQERNERIRVPAWLQDERPKTRADCQPGGSNQHRPCPWVGCRHHLALEVSEDYGTIRPNFEGVLDGRKRPLGDMSGVPETCALDVAERQDPDTGGYAGLLALIEAAKGNGMPADLLPLEKVGEYGSVTLERTRQIERQAVLEVRRKLIRLRVLP